MNNCPMLEHNAAICPCTYQGCPKHGNCCQCLHYHRKRGELPACYFTAEEEAAYDRSIAFFVKNRN